MKKTIAFSFLFLFILASFNQLALLGVYVLNQDFITEKFCVNKEKPELKCKGKCHLNDVMLQMDNQAQDEVYSVATFFLPVYYESSELNIPSPNELDVKDSSQIVVLYSCYSGMIFHPPQVV